MQINQSNATNLNYLNGIFNESERTLDKTQSINKANKTKPVESQAENEESENPTIKERITYGLVSLEIMSDEQYKSFERVTAGMSPNEKIAVAQILTRAGNLSASVERVKEREEQTQAIADQNLKSATSFLGVTQEGWREIAQEFQDNLNNLKGIYTKNYNGSLTSNYNDILRKNTEAKTQRILREFSNAVHSGNVQIDMMG